MLIKKLFAATIMLLGLSVAVLAYCIHLKLCHNGQKEQETKGVFPTMQLWDISNFADPAKMKLQAKEIDNDSTRDYKNNSLTSKD